jgi:lambda family phage tail tape measure protein
MSQTTELLLRIKQQGGEQLTRLSGSFKNLGQQAAAANVNFKEVSDELRKIQQTSANSINNLKGYANAWREIANSVEIGTAEFKQANAEAAKLEAQLKKVQPGGGTGRLMGLARGAGTVAAAGVFGGPLGAVGALAGAPFGLAGMAAGGAIGAQAGMMGQQVAGLASYTASIERQRTALKLVTEDSVSYQQALDFINTTSQRLAIPQEQITRQFTQLSASVLGAGGNVRDAEKAFLGIAAGIRGTGGSLQDMEAALRATAQVFSKGKVSAEELRQQIGERLPGAFTLFAKSVGMTPQELDKALEDGKVSLQDFQKFAEELFKRYGQSAEIIAKGPQSAGDRLQASLSKLSESVGRLLAPIGAAFQTIFADIVNAITRAANALARFMGMKFYDPERIADLERRIREQSAMLAGPADSMTARRRGLLTQLQSELRQERSRIPSAGAGTTPRPSGLPGITADGAGGAGSNKAQQEANRQQRLLERRNDLTRKAGELERKLNFRINENVEALQALGATAWEKIENNYNKSVRQAAKETDDFARQIFNLAKQAAEAGGNLNEGPLVQALVQLEEASNELAKGESAQAMSDWFASTEDGFRSITDKVYENARAMQYNADIMGGLKDGLVSYADNVGTVREAFANLANQGIKGVENSIFDLMTTGTTNYQAFAAEILNQTARMIIQQYVLKTIMSALGFLGGPSSSAVAPLSGVSQYNMNAASFNPLAFTGGFKFAMGGIMTPEGPLKLRRYAAGGIATGPQLAMYGEGSRPEAYVPLPDGRSIPVRMQGGSGAVNVVVNVDASGTSAQGDNQQATRFGEQMGAAIRAQIIKEKRPGGLLA